MRYFVFQVLETRISLILSHFRPGAQNFFMGLKLYKYRLAMKWYFTDICTICTLQIWNQISILYSFCKIEWVPFYLMSYIIAIMAAGYFLRWRMSKHQCTNVGLSKWQKTQQTWLVKGNTDYWGIWYVLVLRCFPKTCWQCFGTTFSVILWSSLGWLTYATDHPKNPTNWCGVSAIGKRPSSECKNCPGKKKHECSCVNPNEESCEHHRTSTSSFGESSLENCGFLALALKIEPAESQIQPLRSPIMLSWAAHLGLKY